MIIGANRLDRPAESLRDEGIAYAQKLQQAGVKVKHSDYLGMIHGFFSLGHILDRTKDVVNESCAELRAAFTRKDRCG